MKILAHVHAFPPHHNAGAEHMLLAMLLSLRAKGHDVRVWIREEAYKFPSEYEGLPLLNANNHPCEFEPWHHWADIIITHLDCTGEINNYGFSRGLSHKLVWICHNSHNYIDFVRRPNTYSIVYNSQWLQDKMQYPQDQTIIIRPPVNYADYEVETNRKYITLVNCNEAKGGKMLIELAKRMPDREFLGVKGSYGIQETANLPNLAYVNNTADIKAIYAQTDIILMPSSYESWGRVAIEAYSSGIPVIAHPTPGLLESMGHGGVFAMRSSVDAWVSAIRNLEIPEEYANASAYARARAVSLDPTEELNLFEKFLCEKYEHSEV